MFIIDWFKKELTAIESLEATVKRRTIDTIEHNFLVTFYTEAKELALKDIAAAEALIAKLKAL